MLAVGDHRCKGPFHPFFEGVFANVAALFHTDAAGEVETSVGVDKELHGLAIFALDQRRERVDLGMRFEDVEVPGYGQMTVDVEAVAVFDDAEIVQVDPVFTPMFIQVSDQIV